ncbi:MAG: 2-C-methyl-D-erythritol 4-phosphate cytidylyltransferase [Rhizobiaceae bacterium]|nr:2-C-methyl-D-erythritol 4-phosphate cytidylyltransferase [Rhizobiaceae bacterium]
MPLDSKNAVSLLLLSGGVGQRSRHHEPKQFYELAGHPLIAYPIIAAVKVERIAEIVVNAPEGYEARTEQILASYCGSKAYKILPAGQTRHESSRILTEAATYDTVVLHEAARPFVDKDMLQNLLDCGAANAGYCLPIPFSMCQIDPETKMVQKGVPRDMVYNIQLPQLFERSTLAAAHRAAAERGLIYTEDTIMCLEMVGAKIMSLQGASKNLKVTTWEDFSLAEQIMNRSGK